MALKRSSVRPVQLHQLLSEILSFEGVLCAPRGFAGNLPLIRKPSLRASPRALPRPPRIGSMNCSCGTGSRNQRRSCLLKSTSKKARFPIKVRRLACGLERMGAPNRRKPGRKKRSYRPSIRTLFSIAILRCSIVPAIGSP